MRFRTLLAFLFTSFAASHLAATDAPKGRGLVLAGEVVRFDESQSPVFTLRQLQHTDAVTRAGLTRWAETDEGRALLARFRGSEYEVVVLEDRGEPALGRAPQPGLATLLSWSNTSALKTYTLILNPALAAEYEQPKGNRSRLALRPEDILAAAWAGEMLHIDFYSRGIVLPHHHRADFQERWRAVANQLRLSFLTHGDEDEVPSRAESSWRGRD
jgi:hypothetical protein